MMKENQCNPVVSSISLTRPLQEQETTHLYSEVPVKPLAHYSERASSSKLHNQRLQADLLQCFLVEVSLEDLE